MVTRFDEELRRPPLRLAAKRHFRGLAEGLGLFVSSSRRLELTGALENLCGAEMVSSPREGFGRRDRVAAGELLVSDQAGRLARIPGALVELGGLVDHPHLAVELRGASIVSELLGELGRGAKLPAALVELHGALELARFLEGATGPVAEASELRLLGGRTIVATPAFELGDVAREAVGGALQIPAALESFGSALEVSRTLVDRGTLIVFACLQELRGSLQGGACFQIGLRGLRVLAQFAEELGRPQLLVREQKPLRGHLFVSEPYAELTG